jgi:cytochrome c55X
VRTNGTTTRVAFRTAGWMVLALSVCGALSAAAIGVGTAPPPARQSELIYLLKQDCGACHGMTLKGGLGPALLPGAIAGKDNETLVDTILDGRPGTPMPPWRFEIAPREAAWLVKQLRKGVDKR